MFRKLALSFILTVCSIAVSNFSFANLITVNGGSTPYTLNSGDTLFIQSGTYTGNIGGFALGATIIVSDLATFQPTGMNFPNVRGTMYIYGTFIMNNSPQFRTNSNFTMHNYGMVQINYETLMSGSNQTWTNYYGATMNFLGNVTMNGLSGDLNNVLINYETINSTGTFQMNSGSSLTNYKQMSVTGTYRVNGGTLINEGKLDVTGNILMNNGASVIRNYCGMTATAGVTNTSGNFYNYSYLHAINSDITNSANIINVVSNHSTPTIHGRDLVHTGGSITGPAYLYFEGFTQTTGAAVTGVSGFTTDTIKMYDITRFSPATIYDDQRGTVHPNVIYNAWGVPDPTRVWWWGCSIEILLEVPLAIDWNYFFVNLSDNIPVLTWSAEYSQGTAFEVQRSYDGTNFSSIKDLPSEVGQSEYKHSDGLVNTNAAVVYYRIKGIELSGAEKYTQTRIVRFRNKQGVSIYTAPNPFKNNFIINYMTSEKEMLTIRMFNVSGQQKLVKNVSVNNGNNIIDITEAANLASGLYVIQVSSGNNIVLSGKIIKQ